MYYEVQYNMALYHDIAAPQAPGDEGLQWGMHGQHDN